MRVLHVLSGLHAAGIEVLALQLIGHSPVAVQAELLNTNRQAQAQAPAFAELQRSGKLAAIHQWRRCDGPVLAWRTFRLCRQRRPDALLIYPCYRPMFWLALGARLAGVRRLAVHLGNTAPADPHGLRTWHRLLLWFQRLGVIAVPCSQAIVDSLQPLPARLRLGPLIANGCDVRAIAERAAAARARRPPGDARRVLMVARLDPIKDQATLLQAFAAARQPGWELQLVGEGPERPRLEALSRELGLNPAAVLLGRRSDIPELLGQADLFAFSTTAAEGFGIALIEAMAAGLPILASDVPACRELLKDGAVGELVAAGEQKAWSAGLRKLMTDASSCQGLAVNAQAHAGSYGILTTADKWYQLLKQ
jgi:glycosyltransferase involved in cell wall biosynthesis